MAKGRLSEQDMLITLATMAYQDDDFAAHDVIEALKAHGYGDVLYDARSELEARASARVRKRPKYRLVIALGPQASARKRQR